MAPSFGKLSEKAELGRQLSGQFLGEAFLANVLENTVGALKRIGYMDN